MFFICFSIILIGQNNPPKTTLVSPLVVRLQKDGARVAHGRDPAHGAVPAAALEAHQAGPLSVKDGEPWI